MLKKAIIQYKEKKEKEIGSLACK